MSSDPQEPRELIIIGSGPAGLTAAIYASRANLAPLVIEGVGAGGQLMTTTDVENYPGFPDGVVGPELMIRFRDQAERFGTEFVTDDVTSVDFSSRPFRIRVHEDDYLAKSVIVSTGAAPRRLGLPSEDLFWSRGVSSCATCDGAFFKEMDLAVIGGGDSALEEALFLTRFATKVTLIHRRKELRASKVMQDRAFANPKIDFLWDTTIDEIVGGMTVEGVKTRNVHTGVIDTLPVRGVFLGIGHIPNSALFRDQLDMDDEGYLLVKRGSTETNIAGVFACGDVVDRTYRQAVTAAGTGCMASIDAERWLEAEHDPAPGLTLTQLDV